MRVHCCSSLFGFCDVRDDLYLSIVDIAALFVELLYYRALHEYCLRICCLFVVVGCVYCPPIPEMSYTLHALHEKACLPYCKYRSRTPVSSYVVYCSHRSVCSCFRHRRYLKVRFVITSTDMNMTQVDLTARLAFSVCRTIWPSMLLSQNVFFSTSCRFAP